MAVMLAAANTAGAKRLLRAAQTTARDGGRYGLVPQERRIMALGGVSSTQETPFTLSVRQYTNPDGQTKTGIFMSRSYIYSRNSNYLYDSQLVYSSGDQRPYVQDVSFMQEGSTYCAYIYLGQNYGAQEKNPSYWHIILTDHGSDLFSYLDIPGMLLFPIAIISVDDKQGGQYTITKDSEACSNRWAVDTADSVEFFVKLESNYIPNMYDLMLSVNVSSILLHTSDYLWADYTDSLQQQFELRSLGEADSMIFICASVELNSTLGEASIVIKKHGTSGRFYQKQVVDSVYYMTLATISYSGPLSNSDVSVVHPQTSIDIGLHSALYAVNNGGSGIRLFNPVSTNAIFAYTNRLCAVKGGTVSQTYDDSLYNVFVSCTSGTVDNPYFSNDDYQAGKIVSIRIPIRRDQISYYRPHIPVEVQCPAIIDFRYRYLL